MKKKALLRVLKDFPWLWAIKDFWVNNSTEIKIGYATLSLLNQEFNQDDFPCGIWVKLMADIKVTNTLIMEIKKVEIKYLDLPQKFTLAKLIEKYPCPNDDRIEFLIIIHESSIIGFNHQDRLTIYRPLKGQKYFN
jgi:hypothetical protein